MRINFKDKYYTHFDIKKRHVNYLAKIKNPSWIVKHGFYPFIHYQVVFHKFVTDKETGKRIKKDKVRDICYSAHIDRLIYQYYAEIINYKYNEYVKKIGIDKVVTAYRNNKKGRCNIHFSKEAIEFICKCEKAWIFVGDFSGFFDNLDAQYIKEKLQDVIGKKRLPDDLFKIYRSVTKYSYIERADIERFKGKKCTDMRNLEKYFDTKEFQEFKKQYLKKNEKSYGIPQGSSISAVFANIYMIDFDKKINDYVTTRKGMYRRYCDDIIIIIPMNKNEVNSSRIQEIQAIRKSIPRLELNLDKTEQFYYDFYEDKRLINLKGGKNILDYLGFSFDGRYVRLREKSLFKYYCRAYKKVKSVKLCQDSKSQIAAKKGLYKLYTHLGDTRSRSKHGNFLTYARRAEEIFSKTKYPEKIQSKIHNQVKKHWNRINKRLKE